MTLCCCARGATEEPRVVQVVKGGPTVLAVTCVTLQMLLALLLASFESIADCDTL